MFFWFKIILLMIIFISSVNADKKETIDTLRALEYNVGCYKKYLDEEDKEDKSIENKSVSSYEKCLKNLIRHRTEEDIYKKVIQILVTSSENGAIDEVKKYNKWKEKVKILKTSSAKYIKRKVKNHKNIPDGTYYFVLVYQKNIDIQTLLNNIRKIYKKNYLDAFNSKIPKE